MTSITILIMLRSEGVTSSLTLLTRWRKETLGSISRSPLSINWEWSKRVSTREDLRKSSSTEYWSNLSLILQVSPESCFWTIHRELISWATTSSDQGWTLLRRRNVILRIHRKTDRYLSSLNIGLAIYENITLGYKFSGTFLNAIVGKKNCFDDLKKIDPDLYKSLIYIKDMEEDAS